MCVWICRNTDGDFRSLNSITYYEFLGPTSPFAPRRYSCIEPMQPRHRDGLYNSKNYFILLKFLAQRDVRRVLNDLK